MVLFVCALLVVAGSFTARQMEIDVFPDLTAPTVVVMTEASGLAPEEVERSVTYPIETAVNGAPGVRRVRSTSSAGYSIVWVEFDWDADVYRARQIVAEKLTTVSGNLPADAQAPVIGPQTSIMGEVMFVGLTTDSLSLTDLRNFAEKRVRPRLLTLGGVAQVSVIGGGEREYQIRLDAGRMRHFGVSLQDVLDATTDMNRNAAGGLVNEYANEYIVRGVVATDRVDEIAQGLVKTTAAGFPVTIGDVAEVTIGTKDPATGLAAVDGHPGVILTVTKQPGTDTAELTGKLDREVDALSEAAPAGVRFHTALYRQQNFIDASLSNIQKSLIEGGVFVALVLFVFLMNVRTTLISFVTIPLSLLVTLLVMQRMGLTVNTMSVGGMAIAIGSLVDDAIVDVENVYKRLRLNAMLPPALRRPRRRVVYEASREVRMPIFNSTLIIIVSFIPLFFLSGLEGRMLAPLGLSFIISLLASTAVALTLTPVLCSYLLHPRRSERKAEPRLVRRMKVGYCRLLRRVFRLPRRAVWATALGLMAVTLGLALSLGRSFLPPFNEGSFTINLAALPGTPLVESDSLARCAERLLLEVDEVQHVARKTGRAELDEHALGTHVSELEVPFVLHGRSKQELLGDVRSRLARLKGVNVEIGQPISHRIDAMLSGTKAAVAIKIFGPDLNRLHSIGREVKQAVAGVAGVADLSLPQQVTRPQIVVKPRRVLLARYGITMPEMARCLRVAFGGEVVSQVPEEGFYYDLTLRLRADQRRRREQIEDLPLTAADGSQVPLGLVADVVCTEGPHTISREDVQRKLVVSANVTTGDLRSVVNDMKRAIDSHVSLPEGYHLSFSGQFESEAEASRLLSLLSVGSVVAILLLLYAQFRSWRQALLILLNLPLALLGGVVALRLTSGILSIPAIIGFISLFGIATRGGMLLVDRFNQMARSGPLTERLLIEGATDRLLPIVMTALSSALALVPLALGAQLPGNEIQSPMAQVILGGLLSSTLLNLLLVPALFLSVSPSPSPSARRSGRRSPWRQRLTALLRRSGAPLAALVAALAPTAASAQSDSLLLYIERHNTSLPALRRKAEAETMAARAAHRPTDPEVELAYLAGHPKGIDPRTNVNVTQELDWGTLTGRRRHVVSAAGSQAEADYEVARYGLWVESRKLLVETVWLNKLHRLYEQKAHDAHLLEQLYERKAAEGAATQPELHKVRLNSLMARTALQRLQARRRKVGMQLATLAGGKEVVCVDTVYASRLPSMGEVMQAAGERHPLLRKALTDTRRSEAELALAKVMRRPSLTLGFAGEYIKRNNYSGLSFGFTLPLWGRTGAEVRKAEAEKVTAQLTEVDVRRQVSDAARTAWQEAEALQRTADELAQRTEAAPAIALLDKALDMGQLSLIDYLLERSFYYDALEAQLEAEHEAQQAASDLQVLIAM